MLYYHMETHPWCLVQQLEICLIQKCSRLATKISQNNKKVDFFLYFNFIPLFFSSIIAKIIIKSKKKMIPIISNKQTAGE